MGAHTAALQPAHIDSDDDDDDDDGDDGSAPTTTSTAPHTAADAAADTTCEVCFVAPHDGFALVPCGHGLFARAARTALLLWTRAQSAVETSPW